MTANRKRMPYHPSPICAVWWAAPSSIHVRVCQLHILYLQIWVLQVWTLYIVLCMGGVVNHNQLSFPTDLAGVQSKKRPVNQSVLGSHIVSKVWLANQLLIPFRQMREWSRQLQLSYSWSQLTRRLLGSRRCFVLFLPCLLVAYAHSPLLYSAHK